MTIEIWSMERDDIETEVKQLEAEVAKLRDERDEALGCAALDSAARKLAHAENTKLRRALTTAADAFLALATNKTGVTQQHYGLPGALKGWSIAVRRNCLEALGER